MKRRPFIVVEVEGGLIESARPVGQLAKARRLARALWASKGPDDDVKVLGGARGDVIYWMPPKGDQP